MPSSTDPTALPFPLIPAPEDDLHPSGCDLDCATAPLHVTRAALETLRRTGVPEPLLQAVLRQELRVHSLTAMYPAGAAAPAWTARIRATLESLGVPSALIDAAEARAAKKTARAAHSGDDARITRQDYLRKWRENNRERVAEHSRNYRTRRRGHLHPV